MIDRQKLEAILGGREGEGKGERMREHLLSGA